MELKQHQITQGIQFLKDSVFHLLSCRHRWSSGKCSLTVCLNTCHLQTSISISFFTMQWCVLTFLYLLPFQVFILPVYSVPFSKKDLSFTVCLYSTQHKCQVYLNPLDFALLQVIIVVINNKKASFLHSFTAMRKISSLKAGVLPMINPQCMSLNPNFPNCST